MKVWPAFWVAVVYSITAIFFINAGRAMKDVREKMSDSDFSIHETIPFPVHDTDTTHSILR
jgi:hypothetical protein